MADRGKAQGIGEVVAPGEVLRCALERIVFFESRVSLKIAREALKAVWTHYAPYLWSQCCASARSSRRPPTRAAQSSAMGPDSWGATDIEAVQQEILERIQKGGGACR